MIFLNSKTVMNQKRKVFQTSSLSNSTSNNIQCI